MQYWLLNFYLGGAASGTAPGEELNGAAPEEPRRLLQGGDPIR